jgi:hypothetical protein
MPRCYQVTRRSSAAAGDTAKAGQTPKGRQAKRESARRRPRAKPTSRTTTDRRAARFSLRRVARRVRSTKRALPSCSRGHRVLAWLRDRLCPQGTAQSSRSAVASWLLCQQSRRAGGRGRVAACGRTRQQGIAFAYCCSAHQAAARCACADSVQAQVPARRGTAAWPREATLSLDARSRDVRVATRADFCSAGRMQQPGGRDEAAGASPIRRSAERLCGCPFSSQTQVIARLPDCPSSSSPPLLAGFPPTQEPAVPADEAS